MNLYEKRTALIEEFDTIMAKEARTEEDEARLDALDTEIEAVEKDIERTEKSEARKDKFKTPVTEPILDMQDADKLIVGEDREAEKPFQHLGETLIAIKAASNRNHPVVSKRLIKLMEGETRAAGDGSNEGTGADGGFLVETDQQKEIFTRMYDNSQVLPSCSNFTASTDSNSMTFPAVSESSRANGSRMGGVQAYWKSEFAQLTASAPTFEEVELKLNKLTALWYASEEMLKDSAVLGQFANKAFGGEIAFKIQDSLINGDGVGKPLGINSSGGKVTASAVAGQGADTVIYDNIVQMWSQLYAPNRRSAVWFINQEIEPQLYTMSLAVGTGGSLVYMPASASGTDGAANAPFGRLMGRPVIPIEQCSALGDEGDIILASMEDYYTLTKGTVEQAMSIHLKFDYDQTAFRWVVRFDGKLIWSSTLTPYKGSATLAPIVTLSSTRT